MDFSKQRAQSAPKCLNELDQIAFELEEWIRQPDWAEDFSLEDTVNWINARPLQIVSKLRALAAQPPAAPVDSGSMYGEYTPITVRASTAPVDPVLATIKRADELLDAAEAPHSRSSAGNGGLPEIPDDDADFTPDLARKIIAKYQAIISMRNSDIDELRRALNEPQRAPEQKDKT